MRNPNSGEKAGAMKGVNKDCPLSILAALMESRFAQNDFLLDFSCSWAIVIVVEKRKHPIRITRSCGL